MKKVLLILGLITMIFVSGCAPAAYTEATIIGNWFCQLGEDGGLLENEFDFELKSDGTYTYTLILMALGIQDSNNSGREYGNWSYSESDMKLTFVPNSGSEYSFTITRLTSPTTRSNWTDLDEKLDTSGFSDQGNLFEFTHTP